MVKVWGIEDIHLDEDLAEMAKRFRSAQEVMEDLGIDEKADDLGIDERAEADDVPLMDNLPLIDDFDEPGPAVDVPPEEQQGLGGDRIVIDDFLLQFDAIDDSMLGGDERHPQPGGGDEDPLIEVCDDCGPAANTRSKNKCASCCCLPHHSFSTHMRKSQLGEMPMIACQLEAQQVFKLFSNVQVQETTNSVKENTIEGILWAVGHNIVL